MKKAFTILLTLLVPAVVVVLWNVTRPPTRLDTSYNARWSTDHGSRPTFHAQVDASDIVLSRSGVEALEGIVLSFKPVRNPLRVVWEHLVYWANERSYPVKLYLESDAGPRMVYYQRGRFVFLRHALHRYDVVLMGTVQPPELEARLKPFVLGLPGNPDWAGPVEAEHPRDSS